MSGWFRGLGLLSSYPKCSAYLLSCLSTPVGTVPFLSLIGRSDFLNFPANFFVVSYSCFMFLLAAALSASSAGHSTKSRLSVLTFFLISLFAAVCYFWDAAFAALVRLLLTAPFLSFLICIFLIVSAEIQSFCCGFLLPSTSSHVVFTVSLMWLQCLSMFTPSSSSSTSWRTLNLLLKSTFYYGAVFFIRQIIHIVSSLYSFLVYFISS